MLGTFLAALVFAAACNLDTVILAMGCGMRGVRLTVAQTMVIGGITTLVTWMSLVLGDTAAAVLPEGLAELLLSRETERYPATHEASYVEAAG